MKGIEVWTDFDWARQFASRGRQKSTTQFRHGLKLASLVVEEARNHPNQGIPALILTTRRDAEEISLVTDTHYVVVVRIEDYLELARADAARCYFALRLKGRVTTAARLREPLVEEEVIGALMATEGGISALVRWAAKTPSVLQLLSEQLAGAGVQANKTTPLDTSAINDALDNLTAIDTNLLTTVTSLIERLATPAAKASILTSITSDTAGRIAATEVIGNRLEDRINDAEFVANEYDALIHRPDVGETAVQNYITEHPWIIGLEYTRVRPHAPTPRGPTDFLLERYDGYHDILELKSPLHRILDPSSAGRGVRPPPSGYRLSESVAQALAQVHVYRRLLWDGREFMKAQYGIVIRSEPHCVLVIGLASAMADHELDLLDELNRSLHRVEIVPFDRLATRSRTFIKNMRLSHLKAGSLAITDSPEDTSATAASPIDESAPTSARAPG